MTQKPSEKRYDVTNPVATPEIVKAIQQQTMQRKEFMWFTSLGENMGQIRKGKGVVNLPRQDGRPALVVASGKSVEIYRHLQKLKRARFKGIVIVCDRSLKRMTRKGIRLDYVVTTDGDPIIADFYKGEKPNKHIKAIFNAITLHPDTLKACPYTPYWFISFLDDPYEDKSYTRLIHYLTNKKPMLQSLGNVGGMAWHLAALLGCNPIGMIGMDFSYPNTTPPEETIYYNAYKELTKGDVGLLARCFREIKNPDTGKTVLVDLNWDTYAQTFKLFASKLHAQSDIQTINCSPLSALFGSGIKYMEFEEFLNEFKV